jgi:glycosyltransferase involved in cell wall biosynthesis
MNIAFDHQIFTRQAYGGISRYFARLASDLMSLNNRVYIMAPLHANRYLDEIPEAIVNGLKFETFPGKTKSLVLAINHQLSKRAFSGLSIDVLHETYYSSLPVCKNARCRIITVYDMIHEKYPSYFSRWDRTIKNKRQAIDRADHVICISHSTKKDLCELYDIADEKVSVVHLGCDVFSMLPSGDAKPRSFNRPFLLYVGSRRGYKNFEGMLRAISINNDLKRNFDVVAFGGGQFTSKENELILRLGFAENSVRQIGGDDNLLARLYLDARAFVYPSIYEGFGLPPLEAMAHGCPVVTSNSSSLPEVVGDAGAYFNPWDDDAQSQAIASVVFDEQLRSKLISSGSSRVAAFTWDRCAQETQAVYQKVITRK